jgi:phytanoyl-CoA hydroxylase
MQPDDEQGKIFEADGFVVLPGLFSRPELAELETHLARYIRDVVPSLPRDGVFYREAGKPETLWKLNSLEKHDAWFRHFMDNARHVPLLEFLLHDRVRPQGLDWFNKLPYDAGATPAHQDGFYWCRKPSIAAALWIALDPVNEDNAGLCYARGSHRAEIRPHVASGVLGFSQGIAGFDPSTVDAVAVSLQPGDAVAHHAGTIHWTGVNKTARQRRGLATFCFGASTVLDEEAHARYEAGRKAMLDRHGLQGSA